MLITNNNKDKYCGIKGEESLKMQDYLFDELFKLERIK